MEQEYVWKNQKRLRRGYTTGSCAAAAAHAACLLLLLDRSPQTVSLLTPKGIRLCLKVTAYERGEDWASCAVKKDAGDDPDVTDGILIYAKASFADFSPKDGEYICEDGAVSVRITGGKGIGRATKPGLSLEVGMPAINRVPRAMIVREVRCVCELACFTGVIRIEISAPQGEDLAGRTFNPRLGIVGGISVLGTSGIVEPMSEQAIIDTIRLELSQLYLAGAARVIVTPGNYGADFVRERLGLNLSRALKCSNFIGETIDMAVSQGLRGLLLIGHAGKLVKLAAGVMNTHSRVADGRMEVLAAWGGACGASQACIGRVLGASTVDEAFSILEETPGLREAVMEAVMGRIDAALKRRAGAAFEIEAIVFTNERGILGMTGGAPAMMGAFRGRVS